MRTQCVFWTVTVPLIPVLRLCRLVIAVAVIHGTLRVTVTCGRLPFRLKMPFGRLLMVRAAVA